MKHKRMRDFVMMEEGGKVAIGLHEKEVNLDIYFVDIRLEGNSIFIESNNYESNTGMQLSGISERWLRMLEVSENVYLAEVKSNGRFDYKVETKLEKV